MSLEFGSRKLRAGSAPGYGSNIRTKRFRKRATARPTKIVAQAYVSELDFENFAYILQR